MGSSGQGTFWGFLKDNTAPPLAALCWLKEPVSNLVYCGELWSPLELNNVFDDRNHLLLEGWDQGKFLIP